MNLFSLSQLCKTERSYFFSVPQETLMGLPFPESRIQISGKKITQRCVIVQDCTDRICIAHKLWLMLGLSIMFYQRRNINTSEFWSNAITIPDLPPPGCISKGFKYVMPNNHTEDVVQNLVTGRRIGSDIPLHRDMEWEVFEIREVLDQSGEFKNLINF